MIVSDPLSYYIDFARLMVERDIRLYRGQSMARVGFRGLSNYRDRKMVELDARADKLADRLDGVVKDGLIAIDKHDVILDGHEAEIRDLERAAKDLSNGGPPLAESQPPSAPQSGAGFTLAVPDPKVMPFRSS